MFKEIRRKDREIADIEAMENILKKGEYGILATICNNGYPYALPLSYVYKDKFIYIHCATEGLKLDNINSNNKISFCVVGSTEVLPEKFSTIYESVIIFGKAVIVSDSNEKREALDAIVEKYSNEFLCEGREYIKNSFSRVNVVKLIIEDMRGKARRK